MKQNELFNLSCSTALDKKSHILSNLLYTRYVSLDGESTSYYTRHGFYITLC
jgi:hypothetical protein